MSEACSLKPKACSLNIMPHTPYQGPERRRYPRIPFWYIVRYREFTPAKKMIPEPRTSKSKDLSLGGILLETNRCYPVSTLLEIEFDVPLPPAKKSSVRGKSASGHVHAKVLGEVVRSTVIEQDKAYDTAVRFTSIPSEYQKEIRQLIEVFS